MSNSVVFVVEAWHGRGINHHHEFSTLTFNEHDFFAGLTNVTLIGSSSFLNIIKRLAFAHTGVITHLKALYRTKLIEEKYEDGKKVVLSMELICEFDKDGNPIPGAI